MPFTRRARRSLIASEQTGFHFAGAGIFDPEEFKRDFVGNAGGKFDICACKDGSIVLAAVGQCGRPGPKIGTGVTWSK
jgi:hypothetical protein